MMNELAGIAVATVLIGDGLFHAYWATGNTWPAPNQLTLVQGMLNSDKTRLLRPTVLISLVCLLFLGALIVLARIHRLGELGQVVPAPLLQLGILAVATGFLLRGIAGIGWALGLAPARSKLFYKLNLVAYTPLCLLLFVAATITAFA